jgi:hypothetical protein
LTQSEPASACHNLHNQNANAEPSQTKKRAQSVEPKKLCIASILQLQSDKNKTNKQNVTKWYRKDSICFSNRSPKKKPAQNNKAQVVVVLSNPQQQLQTKEKQTTTSWSTDK